ncbi:hypothetical protein NWP96_05030 [Mycoplasmopsis cynos]|nr:hypothetical protein [Mycoplasmopsis cynos]
MFLPYKKLKLGEKFKLKFVKYHLNGAKFLFVQDDNSISYEEKRNSKNSREYLEKFF